MDLDPIQLFGGNTHDPASASSCGFTSKNEKKVMEYLDNLKKYLKDHKVVERVDRLIEEAPRLPRESIKWRFDGINNDITHGMLSAEQKVKPKTFKYEWSVELDQVGYRVQYW